MAGGFVRLAAVVAVLAASQASAEDLREVVLCEYKLDANGKPELCRFEGYITINSNVEAVNFMNLDPVPFTNAAQLNARPDILDEMRETLQKVLPGKVVSVKAVKKEVKLPTIRLKVEYEMAASESDGLKMKDPLKSKFRAVFPKRTDANRNKLGATRKQKANKKGSNRIKQVKPKEIINGKVQEAETEEDDGFKKAAAHSSGGAYSQPYPYPSDMSDPYPFPENWAAWGSSQSWNNWPSSSGGGSSGGYGGGYREPYDDYHHHYDDDDDDDGRRTIKVIIVILVILVQIGLIILIAVCIKHYCCSDKKSAATAPAQLEAPMGTRTAVVTPIHIIHGAPVASNAASPMVMHRAMSTPVPPSALALEVPGPANYQAPSPQQLRRATSLTAIIA